MKELKNKITFSNTTNIFVIITNLTEKIGNSKLIKDQDIPSIRKEKCRFSNE